MDLTKFLFDATSEIDWFQRTLDVAEVFGVVFAAIAAFVALRQTRVIHKEQDQLSKQQMFIPISEKLSNFRAIDIANPNWEHVVTSVNLLELVVLVQKKHMVDPEMLLYMYGELFIQIFDQIYLARDPISGRRRGQTYLDENTKGVIEEYKRLCKMFGKKDLTLSAIAEKEGGTNGA